MSVAKLLENIKDSQAEANNFRAAVSAVNGQAGLGPSVRVLIPTESRDPVAVVLPKAVLLRFLNDKIADIDTSRAALQAKLKQADNFLKGLN